MAMKEVELKIPLEYKDEPIFYQIVKQFAVIPNIVEASFSTEMGWAIVRFDGEEEEIQRVFEFLKGKRVEIEER